MAFSRSCLCARSCNAPALSCSVAIELQVGQTAWLGRNALEGRSPGFSPALGRLPCYRVHIEHQVNTLLAARRMSVSLNCAAAVCELKPLCQHYETDVSL
jgi:hypothetical protein